MHERVVVGARGLVGSAFCRYFESHKLSYTAVQREEAQSHGIEKCGLLVLACGNANKGKANADPAWDFTQSVEAVASYVHMLKPERTILISTVDVYPDPSSVQQTAEAYPLNPLACQPYGFHKWLAEQYVQKFSGKHLVLRLPALVGPGLTKNPVFDYFALGKPLFVSPLSRLNVVHVDDVARHAMHLVAEGVEGETFNLAASAAITVGDFPVLFGGESQYVEGADKNIQTYDINIQKVLQFVTLCSSENAVKRYQSILQK
ncbi:NAD-dependent epimerase/dehydratase family protein [Kordiimonas pumila]|uniref:NAD-dependent epimerase/dehydratase family protein n=1 Tax=Kordiimonas pumila TaxID=2161677 RepID=A0ABV7D164_9PROT|nr:NAD-dependent epimerase/dehydratase family protein [Kordiimonas pumila]